MPLRIFRSRPVAAANAIQILSVAGMFGMFFLGALYLRRVLGYDALQIGLAFLPVTIAMGTLSIRYSERIFMALGARRALLAGLTLVLAGLVVFALAPVHADYATQVAPSMLLLGLGAGTAFPALMNLAMSGATPQDAGLASGLVNTTAQVGGALGLAVLATLSTSRSNALTASGHPTASALTSGYHLAFWVAAALVGCALAVVLAAVDPAVRRPGAHGAAHAPGRRGPAWPAETGARRTRMAIRWRKARTRERLVPTRLVGGRERDWSADYIELRGLPYQAIVSHPQRYRHAGDELGLGWCAGMIGDRWGVTQAETTRPYPCDDLMPDPVLQAWRGVMVRARPEHVWPWVAQIRLAPYSYDLIDNLGRRSPQDLRGLPEPVVGEPFTAALGGFRLGRIVAVESGKHLTGTIMGAVMSYVLVPIDDVRHTRLLMKLVTSGGRMTAPLLSVGDLIMARRQLLNLKALAERTAVP